jgi:N-acyl-D-aspartate/D-glutamate deacylase
LTSRRRLAARLPLAVAGLFALASLITARLDAQATYDIVLHGGRVLDPESGLDAVRDVGISGRRIAAVSATPLHGRVDVDVTGLVVAPGFIDLHSHGQTPEAYRFKAMDGVTTALELEVGVSPVPEWYAARVGKSLINFGASSGHIPARMAVMHDTGGLLPRDNAVTKVATTDEQRATEDAVRAGLQQGGLGVGMGIAYLPTASPAEILDVFYLAASFHRPVFVHMRSGDIVTELQEVIADSAASGAPVHVVHLNSMALDRTAEALRIVEGARARGLDVTTEAYPYTASMTDIASAIYDGWDKRPDADFTTLLWPPTGERLTRESFLRYRKQGGMVVHFGNTEEMVRLAIAHPAVMIASDGIIDHGQGHPRGAGTYARVLGKYVREEHVLSLMDAVRKSSLMPAQRLEAMSPQMRQKGRIKVGSDADIAVFDPSRVIDKATFDKPAQYSDGFRDVLVGGVFVVRDGQLQESATPGEGILAR